MARPVSRGCRGKVARRDREIIFRLLVRGEARIGLGSRLMTCAMHASHHIASVCAPERALEGANDIAVQREDDSGGHRMHLLALTILRFAQSQ